MNEAARSQFIIHNSLFIITMNIQQSLSAVLTQPSTDTLWQLRGDLLQAGWPAESPVWEILETFYHFLSELSAGTSAHQYSQIASLLDIGAVGGVALENLLQSDSSTDLWQRFLAGGISEGLMVLASRQYIKAFKVEMATVYQSTAWILYRQLWQLSVQAQPELDVTTRRQLIDNLLAPIHDDSVPEVVKIGLNGRLFQILLAQHLRLSAGQLII